MRLAAEQVSWSAGGRRIVDQVDLVCEDGLVTGLLGPNGSGKTSLLTVMAGLRVPDEGRVTIGGDDLHAWSPRERARHVAMLEQQATTGLDLSVRQVIELGRIPHRGRWPARTGEGRGAIESAVDVGRVGDLLDRSWATLSGGERQRTQLARALAQEPEVLVLDEPTNHLDLGHQIDFLRTVRDLGITTVAALHDLDLAVTYCDRIAVLDAGGVVVFGPPNEVLTADLVLRVYGVAATIEHHAGADRLSVVWHR